MMTQHTSLIWNLPNLPRSLPLSLPFSSPSHGFAFQFDVLKVLGELHADAGHHVFRDELPLAGVVVQLVQDLLEWRVIAESAAEDLEKQSQLTDI